LALILGGLYKTPLLALFEKYGDAENQFQPVTQGAAAVGALIASGAALSAVDQPWVWALFWIGLALAVTAAYAVLRTPPSGRWRHDDWPQLPRWYYALRQYTTRQERRRIAYMWLWLPRRTRSLYHANDRAFLLWADLVIAGTLSEELS
jgi:MFS family permease